MNKTEFRDLKTRLLVTPREAAQRLAISERLLWQLTSDGAIRSVRVGKRGKRYDLRDLVAFIDSQKGADDEK